MANCKACGSDFTRVANWQKYCGKCPSLKFGKVLSANKINARKLKVPHNIDIPYIVQLYMECGGKCQITGEPFDEGLTPFRINPFAPSIDRIIPELGYVKGNVRLVLLQLNYALSNFGEEQFARLAKIYLEAKNGERP